MLPGSKPRKFPIAVMPGGGGEQVKRVSVSGKPLGKACRGREISKDRISELPFEVIVTLVSLLTFKEAGRTSVLSKRWRYAWAYIPVLNFEDSKTFYEVRLEEKKFEEELPRYLRWVNKVVESYKGSAIDEFRVQFGIDNTCGHIIDNWVKFAMERGVKKLDLNFCPTLIGNICYTYTKCSSISNFITSLKLAFVNITGNDLQEFLQSCRSLEYLSVKRSDLLVNLEVTGETLKLKYLEICDCFEVKCIEISAPNLLSFRYDGPIIGMPFKRTPKLATLFVGGDYAQYLTTHFLEFSSYLLLLDALTLELDIGYEFFKISADQFPLCKRLKQLEVIAEPTYYENLFQFAHLIKACPFLHKFVLKLTWFEPDREKRKPRKKKAFRHDHLKVIEILGFDGHVIDLEFIIYLIKSCVALEKIVLDTRDPSLIKTPWEFEESKRKRRARKKAEELRAELLHPGIDLIIV